MSRRSSGGRVQGIEIRSNAPGAELMHLKGYCVDHRLLRTGSANFSRSGETRQDNDLVALRGASVCAGFDAKFDRALGQELTMLTRRRWERVAGVGVAILGLSIASLYILLCVGRFLEAHNGAISAIAAGVIAWFTVTLSRSTRRLAQDSVAQIKLARDEFNATHRPRVRARLVRLDGFDRGGVKSTTR
jgi:phosphatidylserine/phosphatidylglycerophosphate/cardiolipin synthase-like enzyme